MYYYHENYLYNMKIIKPLRGKKTNIYDTSTYYITTVGVF